METARIERGGRVAGVVQVSIVVALLFGGACGAADDAKTGDALSGTGGFMSAPLGTAGMSALGLGSGGKIGLAPTTGSGGKPATIGGAGAGVGAGGITGSAGMIAMTGSGGTTAADAGVDMVPIPKGACCADGDCLCHGPDPMELTSSQGPFKVDSYELSTGTVYYPSDAEPPFAAIAICPGFLNTGPEMAPWGPFYASHGFVLITAYTGAADIPDIRAGLLLAAVDELKGENTKSGSPLSGKLAGRYGTSGYSMGGGGTTIASSTDSTLKTSIGLAAWGGATSGISVPTLLFCGDADTVAPCNMSDPVYAGIADSTPKMMIVVSGATHFNWFDPADLVGTSGKYGLAFQKVFLEGDERWKPLLLGSPAGGTATTNIH